MKQATPEERPFHHVRRKLRCEENEDAVSLVGGPILKHHCQLLSELSEFLFR